MLRLFILAMMAARAAGVGAWKLCDEALSAVRVEEATLSPTPSQRAQPLVMTIVGKAADAFEPDDLNGGQAEISVSRGGHTLYKNGVDLCSTAASTCSSSDDGEVQISYSLTLPRITPPGAYVVTLTGEYICSR